MTNLVHRLLLGSSKRTIIVDSVLLEEKPYLIARVQEILVTDVVIIAGDKLCLSIAPSIQCRPENRNRQSPRRLNEPGDEMPIQIHVEAALNEPTAM
jgi:hypothetical protein